ncbi:MAG TPA: hypothetical protein DD381_14445 [Lentisphaeria bacterium]|nr:MAG: hypothetical protein A2X47_00825 [Lentisphaerae bacterium GWF2_38_69]HBM17525.1 hypothetical protein [Lentisphaeria bacterium]
MLEIREIKTNRELKAFVNFPLELYKNNTYFVPPILSDEIKTLRKDKNPSFEFCEARYWMAYKDNKIVGRIAGIINNKANEIWKQNHIRFGWIDFIDDQEVSSALLNEIENWGKEKGLTHIQGPLGFCDLDKEGMLVEGFDEISMMHSYYNYSYYPKHLEKFGYEKEVDWVESKISDPNYPDRLKRMISIAKKKLSNYTSVKFKTPKDVFKYRADIVKLLNTSYESIFGYVPINEKIFDHYFKSMILHTNLEYITVIKDPVGDTVGFGLAMPLLSYALQSTKGRLFPLGFIKVLKAFKKNDYVTLLLIAVRPDLQSKGIPIVIIENIDSNFIKNGVKTVEVSHMLESNEDVQHLWTRQFNARQHKRRRCYIKTIK